MSAFETLNQINVNDRTEDKDGLTYLSWAWAWAEVKKVYPDAKYTIKKFGEAQLPYVYDENTGYMVFTDVTIEGQTHEMWLCVMDGANKAMKSAPYTYKVKNKKFQYDTLNEEDGKYYDKYGNEQPEFFVKTVEAATMFDINKTLMRCLVKNLAMFGLGLYIYAGEDLPEEIKPEPIICEDCGAVIKGVKTKDSVLTPQDIKQRSEEKFGKCICFACANKQQKENADEQG